MVMRHKARVSVSSSTLLSVAYQEMVGASTMRGEGTPVPLRPDQLSQRTGVPVAQNREGVGWDHG